MDDQAVPVVSYARISADTARDEHGVTDVDPIATPTRNASFNCPVNCAR